MNSNYIVLKNYIENNTYDLADAKNRIDYAVSSGIATTEQAAQLIATAEKRATEPVITTKSLDERVTDLELAMLDVLGMLAELLGLPEEMPDEIPEEIPEELPEETVIEDGGAE